MDPVRLKTGLYKSRNTKECMNIIVLAMGIMITCNFHTYPSAYTKDR